MLKVVYGKKTIQGRFEHFHQMHPEVYAILVKYCREVMARGHKHYAIGAAWERLRHHLNYEMDTDQPTLKLCDNYRSRYARLIMKQEKDLQGFFTLRPLKRK